MPGYSIVYLVGTITSSDILISMFIPDDVMGGAGMVSWVDTHSGSWRTGKVPVDME